MSPHTENASNVARMVVGDHQPAYMKRVARRMSAVKLNATTSIHLANRSVSGRNNIITIPGPMPRKLITAQGRSALEGKTNAVSAATSASAPSRDSHRRDLFSVPWFITAVLQ
jgi:hypothetical protein